MIKLRIQPKNTRLSSETSIAHHRLLIDYQELFDEKIRRTSKKCYICFEEPIFQNNIYTIDCGIVPSCGFYKDIPFQLKILIPKDYPFFPPKIFCLTKTVHPNINMLTGEVCLAMLEEKEWIPVMSLNFILLALELIIIQPNIECIPDNQKNQELAQIFQNDFQLFEKLIEESQFNSGTYRNDIKDNLLGLDIEDQKIQYFEKQVNNMNMQEEKTSHCEMVKSSYIDIEEQEKKKEEICIELEQKLCNIENSKKRYREEDLFVNPFLKQVRIGTGY